MANTWRENLKSGALSQVYGLARSIKRRLRNEPLAGTLVVPQAPLAAEHLRELAGRVATRHILPANPNPHSSGPPTMRPPELGGRGAKPGSGGVDPLAGGANPELGGGYPLAGGANRCAEYSPAAAGHARIQFSLGLAYMEAHARLADRMALVCLRTAEAFDFESPERILLYRALIASRRGENEAAQHLIAGLTEAELTQEEIAVLHGIRQNTILPLVDNAPDPPSLWTRPQLIQPLEASCRILVIDDSEAVSATWMADHPYVLASESVTGLHLTAILRTNMRFGVAIGPAAQLDKAKTLGIACDDWRPID